MLVFSKLGDVKEYFHECGTREFRQHRGNSSWLDNKVSCFLRARPACYYSDDIVWHMYCTHVLSSP